MRFPVISADPPWEYTVWSNKAKRSASRHYKTQADDWIERLPVASVAAKDCALFLWITWPNMPAALKVITAWGFEYKTCAFCWVKTIASRPDAAKMGLGYWTRSNTEPCLLATRGNPKRLGKGIEQIIDAPDAPALVSPLGRHSEKPLETYARIEGLVAGPYLEMLARPHYGMFEHRDNWTRIGNEITGRDMADDLRILAEEGNAVAA